jgi:hypothetical protein
MQYAAIQDLEVRAVVAGLKDLIRLLQAGMKTRSRLIVR